MVDDPSLSELTDDPVFDGLLRAIAAAPVSEQDQTPVLPLEVGRTFGAFELLEVIGRGGSGVVYRARDPRLGREVALKLLWDAPGREARSERLLFEARSAAGFVDPRIASIYEVGEIDGRPFIAMELVRGTSLRARLAGGPLPAPEALALAVEIARALASIHARDWVHLDVKPENIAVNEAGEIKLLDFGIARPTGPRPPGEPIAGTPAYMAPEQRLGGEIDARADVYAFGVLLEEVLTGKPSRAVTPLPVRGLDGWALRRLLEDCLSPEPARRPPSGAGLVARLEAVRQGPRRRRRRLQAAAAVVFVLSAFYTVFRPRPAAPPTLRNSARLTGHQLARPISAANLSWDGRSFAYVDDDGLVVAETETPDLPRRITFDPLPTYVASIPGTRDWLVLTSSTSGPTGAWRLRADQPQPQHLATEDFTFAALNPVDGRVAWVKRDTLSIRTDRGLEVWRHETGPTRLLASASWSPDGARLAIAFIDLGASGPTPCLELWSPGDLRALFSLCSSRLAQTYAPVVNAWGPDGELLYALSDLPGSGRGAAVMMQRFDEQGEADGAPVLLLDLEQQYLAAISMSQDRTLLTLRQETTLRPMVAPLSNRGILGAPVRLGTREFDGRLGGWATADSLWSVSYREWVPRVRVVRVSDGVEALPELPGWAQSWPTPVGKDGGTLFWYAERPSGEDPPTWRLAHTSSVGVRPVWTPGLPKEPLSVAGAPPSTFQVRCASQTPTCLLGAPGARGFSVARLSLTSTRAEPLFQLEGYQPPQGAWQILPDASGILVAPGGGRVVTYALDGRVIASIQLRELSWVRSIGVDPSSGAVYFSGHGPSVENFRIVRFQDGRESVVKKHGATVYLDVLPSPDGRRLAFVEKAIDTDIWVSSR